MINERGGFITKRIIKVVNFNLVEILTEITIPGNIDIKRHIFVDILYGNADQYPEVA